MPHPELTNRGQFSYESLFLADENGQMQFVPLVQALFAISLQNTLALKSPQPAINLGGEWWSEDAEKSSLKYEPQMAFQKPATDVALIGHAWAPAPGVTDISVGLRVGPLQKVVRVIGDRYLLRRSGGQTIGAPRPFEKIPLLYERAFGGWDLRDPNPNKYRFETRNPVGVGYVDAMNAADAEIKLPNLEDPERPYRGFGDTPPPAGFGFISPHWQPRAAFAGTYDAAWDKQRKPLLPKDFDRRYFNAASPGLIAPGYLKGNEPVVIVNASPQGRVAFNLPGAPAPQCGVRLRGGKAVTLQTVLDTVIIDMDQRELILIWRAHTPLRNGPHEVMAVELGAEGGPNFPVAG